MILPGVGIALIVIFSAAWFWARKITNYSIVDAFWAASIGGCGVTFALLENGDLSKRIAAGSIAIFWGGRLAWHLARRIYRHHPKEDSRYEDLRAEWSAGIFYCFFLVQALSVFLLALPFYLVARDSQAWGFFESFGLCLTLVGIIGEILSDHQIARFKQGHADSSAVCKVGLWKYSRHPNYFFESVIWTGIYLFACGSAYGWVTIYAPVLITFLLLRVTGIPATEASAVKRKGSAYLEYQRTTSAFIPLPPKP